MIENLNKKIKKENNIIKIILIELNIKMQTNEVENFV